MRSLLNGSYQKHLRDDVRKTARVRTIVTEKSEQCVLLSISKGLWRIRLYFLFCFCFLFFSRIHHKTTRFSYPFMSFIFSLSPVLIFCLYIPLTVGKTSTEWVWERWTVEEIAKTGEKTEIWNPEVRRTFADVLEWYVPFGCGDLGCLPLGQNTRKCHLKVKWNN